MKNLPQESLFVEFHPTSVTHPNHSFLDSNDSVDCVGCGEDSVE